MFAETTIVQQAVAQLENLQIVNNNSMLEEVANLIACGKSLHFIILLTNFRQLLNNPPNPVDIKWDKLLNLGDKTCQGLPIVDTIRD
jgi:hypothetical protein